MKIRNILSYLILTVLVSLLMENQLCAYEVLGLKLEPLGETTRFTIETDSTYNYNEFFLTSPPRVVIDFAGARHKLSRDVFKDVKRGGVEEIRTSQFTDDTVRVVLVLSEPKEYSLFRKENELMVVLEKTDGDFSPWNSSSPSMKQESEEEPKWHFEGSGGEEAEAKRISMDFEDANIKVVLRAFSDFSGYSIVAGQNVTGRITARITDVPWNEALGMILKANGYGLEYRSGIYVVDKLENLRATERLEGLEPTVFHLNYLMASDVLMTIQSMLTERGSVSLDEKTNSLIVMDVPSKISEIESVLPMLDRETRQVTIKSKLVFVNTVDLNQIGIDWKVGNMTNPRTDVHGEASTKGARLTDPFLQLSLGTFRSGVNISGLLQALQESQLIDVQAQPQITTLDNLEAEVFVGERTPIRVLDVGAETERAATIQLIETGIRLSVTPHITNNNKIVMDLKAERSSAVPDPSEFGVKFQTQEGKTTLLVDDGQTAVIGGLTTVDVVESERAVPVISKIPLVGRLFRFSSKSTQKRDLLIFVTPYVVPQGGES
ncbi:MAG: AMIN domain-containing protein [Candidatus Glassbacteria bacterium]